jgi:hypothetical protein
VFVQSLITRQKAVDDLETKHGAMTYLVKTVCDRMADRYNEFDQVSELRKEVATGTKAAAAPSDSSSDSDPASIRAAAMAQLREGAWSYAEIVDAYLVLLKDMATYATSYFAEALAGELWDAIMIKPPCWDHLEPALVRQQLGPMPHKIGLGLPAQHNEWRHIRTAQGRSNGGWPLSSVIAQPCSETWTGRVLSNQRSLAVGIEANRSRRGSIAIAATGSAACGCCSSSLRMWHRC